MAETLKLDIVTPDGTAYSEDVEMVTLEGIEGQMGILPHHVRLMTQMVPGELIVQKDGSESLLAVGGGLVIVTGSRVTILTDMAIEADKVDEAKAAPPGEDLR
jgi:F-type H+-transporting ATPase subunit epsilon